MARSHDIRQRFENRQDDVDGNQRANRDGTWLKQDRPQKKPTQSPVVVCSIVE